MRLGDTPRALSSFPDTFNNCFPVTRTLSAITQCPIGRSSTQKRYHFHGVSFAIYLCGGAKPVEHQWL